MITDVAIDLDGVLYPFIPQFEKFCSRVLTPPLAPATKWLFYEDWGISKDEFHGLLSEAVHAGVFLHGEPPIGAHAAINAMRERGIKIHFITSRPAESWSDTTWWLDHWILKGDTLMFTHKKEAFALLCEDEGAILEDSPIYMDALAPYNKIHVVAYDQPWNQHCEFDRVHSVMEFARLVCQYNDRTQEFNDYIRSVSESL
jgi:hypothetical protein